MTFWLLGEDVTSAWTDGDPKKVVDLLCNGDGKLAHLPERPTGEELQMFNGWRDYVEIPFDAYQMLSRQEAMPKVYLIYACDYHHSRNSMELVKVTNRHDKIGQFCRERADLDGWVFPKEGEDQIKQMNQTQLVGQMFDGHEVPYEFIVEAEDIDYGHD